MEAVALHQVDSPMSSPEEKLRDQLGPVIYSDLQAHLDRGAVFLVRPDLDLLSCALALATDDAEKVRIWLSEGGLRRPTEEERTRWSALAEPRFVAVPVQPYVLVQEETQPS